MALRKILAVLLVAAISALALATDRILHAAETVAALEARLTNGKAEGPRTLRARQSDIVRLSISSDRRIVLHLHGYNLEATSAPGAPAIFEFTARATGRFPIEEHPQADAAGKEYAHGHAALFLEILPR